MKSATSTVPRPAGPPRAMPSTTQLSSIAGRTRDSGRRVRSDAAPASNSPDPAPSPETISAPAPTPMPAIATSCNPIRSTIDDGAPSESSPASAACIIGPIISGDAIVPMPGRRPMSHAAAVMAPTVAQTATARGSPVRARTAPMKTSSGPGPRSFHSVIATDAEIRADPTTNSPTRPERLRTRRGAPDRTMTATAPARDQARRRSRIATRCRVLRA